MTVADFSEIAWFLVDEVESALAAESAVAGGGELIERIDASNAALRTAWPFVAKLLRDARPAKAAP